MKKYRRVIFYSVFFLFVFSVFTFITYRYIAGRYKEVQAGCIKEAEAKTKEHKLANSNDFKGILTDKTEIYFKDCMKRNWSISAL